jgi:hypothetical protein
VCGLGIHQVQILCMTDSLLLGNNISCNKITGNGRQERLCKPICEVLVWNGSFNQSSPSSSLMNMIGYVGGRGLLECVQKLGTDLIPYRQLKMHKKKHGKRIKVNKGLTRQLNIPFCCSTCKCSLKNPKTDGIIHQRVGGTPQMKVITRTLGSSLGFSLNFWMSDSNLAGMVGQNGACWMGSLVKRDRYGKYNVAKNGSCQLACGY